MKTRSTITYVILTCLLTSSSCISKKQLTYLQFSEKSHGYEVQDNEIINYITPSSYRVMSYDNLFVRVITPDPQWSDIFNIQTGATGLTQESASLSGYPVTIDGYIEMPYVGRIQVGGKTISEIKVELDSIFKNYVTDAVISVRLVNNFISIIGEVNSPGRYGLEKDRVTVFEALSLASDLTIYSDRQKVQLIRPSSYGPVIKEFSLLDRSILSSEYYYLMPNDIIYVRPLSARTYSHNTSIITLSLSIITTALVLVSYFSIL